MKHDKITNKAKVMMLPAAVKSTIISVCNKVPNGKKILLASGELTPSKDTQYENLYFTSDDEIKEGDWCYSIGGNEVLKYKGRSSNKSTLRFEEKDGQRTQMPTATKEDADKEFSALKKIVATTDTDLRHLFGVKEGGCAAISESFVQEYIKSYNDGRIITEVELAISRNKYPDLHGNFYDINIGSDNTVLVLSHNQTIDVEPIKINEDDVDYLKATIKDREVLIGQLDYKRKELQESSDKSLIENTELREEIKNLSEALQDMVNEFHVVSDARNETEQEEAMNNAIELLKKYKKD